MAGWSAPPERSVERDEALVLALPQVPALGWGWRAVEEGLRGAGPKEGGRGEGALLEAELLFPGGAVDMVEAFIDRADRAMAAIAAGPGFAELRTTAKVRALVLGRSVLVGRPMAALLTGASATVTLAHSRTRDLAAECRRAEILVAAAGRAEMVRGDWIAPGAVVIDVGINRRADGKLVGDVAYAEAVGHAGAITPVPGGVGPMTIACLLENTLEAALARRG